jgi:3' exoribonuclease, RNase T-like
VKKHVMIDIEALGLRPGAALTELGAVEFYPDTGWVGTHFEALIIPRSPLTADLGTLNWHAEKGTWPLTAEREKMTIPLRTALHFFDRWYAGLGQVEAVWCWGATYDFPLLQAAYDLSGREMPWRYPDACCARTVWKLAFGSKKHNQRPHRAFEDATSAAVDLMAAMTELRRGEGDD